MNVHFVKIGEKLNVQMTNTSKTYLNFLGKRQITSVYLQPTDNQEIIEIIACLNVRKYLVYTDIPVFYSLQR